jgi:hypothetical protein
MKLERLFQERFQETVYVWPGFLWFVMMGALDMKLKALSDNHRGSMVDRMLFKVACCGEEVEQPLLPSSSVFFYEYSRCCCKAACHQLGLTTPVQILGYIPI